MVTLLFMNSINPQVDKEEYVAQSKPMDEETKQIFEKGSWRKLDSGNRVTQATGPHELPVENNINHQEELINKTL